MTRQPDLTQEELADELGVAVNTIRNWRYQGRGPAFYRVHRRLVKYTRRAVDDYKRARTVQTAA
jgi:hypothetical protein